MVARGSRRRVLCGVNPDVNLAVQGLKNDWPSVSTELRELIRGSALVLGYSSFSATSLWEKVPYRSPQPFSDFEYFGFNNFLMLTEGAAWLVGEPNSYFSLGAEAEPPRSRQEGEIVFESPGFKGYVDIVERAKKHIELGEIFQVVLARKLGLRFEGDYRRVFLDLLDRNPSPYMYYFKMGDRRIIGCSPETLVRLKDGLAETFPIAGTRQVTGDHTVDVALRRELLASAKDAAEHVMLVDLARNDLGKVSALGSVRVTQYRKVLKYSHVQHLVSKVVGRLRPGLDALDVFKAAFPAGTVSGAPKIRAIELIDHFEAQPRGPYAGSVGYFMGLETMDQAINIRSLYSDGKTCVVQAGAGIVAASDPTSEYYETQNKARVVLEALGVREEVVPHVKDTTFRQL